ncbi:MAG: UvrD-helicase domain-containing protein [Mycoplasma sp.]|nr:UvrD-helicase domain-containing protein [Candidatus Hennigella equi]
MDLSRLNKNQKEAVTTTQGPVLVIAGAGTGKTSVLTHRIAYLISELGVDANRILAFTFTNKAADEMRERINRMIPQANAQWIRTYHATCLKILKEDIDKLNMGWDTSFSIIDEDDQVTLVRQIMKDLKIQTKVQAKKFAKIIGLIKLHDISFEEESYYDLVDKFEVPEEQDVRAAQVIYETYQKRLKAADQLDFSDLINYVHKLFTKREDVRKKWQERFDYVLVDEFQDTNLKQFEIIKYLVTGQNNVFAVGDPNQTIYTWRGAYPEVFDDYVDHFKGTKIIKLFYNYRSTPEILRGANNLINNNASNFKNELQPMNLTNSEVNVYIGSYLEDEANFICSTINGFIKQGKKYSDILILYRANYCSKLIEEKLIQNQIPYIIFGTVNFYARKEIKDLMSYLKMIYKPDDVSAMRVINVPKRGIGIDSVNNISSWASQQGMTFVNALYQIEEVTTISDSTKNKVKGFIQDIQYLKKTIEENGFASAIPTIVKELKYIEYLETTELEIDERQENIDELSRSVLEFLHRNPKGTIIDFINEVNLYTSAEKTRVDNSQAVHVMTVHMAKGKEYDSVFVYDFNEGVIPSPNSIIAQGGLEEERRIAYVAMTRAKNNLIITCTRDESFGRGRFRNYVPSRFLKEIKTYKMAYRTTRSISDKDLDWYDSNQEKMPFAPEIDLSKIYTNTEKFKVGDVIVHTTFGSGIVTKVDGSMIDVIFKKPYGKKTIVATHNAIKRVVS